MKFEHTVLDHGLQVVAEVNPQAYSASFGILVNAGSRDETQANSGVSHFLEHMAFKGTASRTAEDVNRQLDEMGSHSNARTGEERTIYHGTVLPEFQTPIIELLCDLMRPSLRDEDFDVEKKVILEEIMMYDDQPPFGGHERIMAAFYGEHPLSKSVLGTTETVAALTPAAMRDYFLARYSADNILVAAAGNVDFAMLVNTLEEQTQNWAVSGSKRTVDPASPHSGFERLHRPQSSQEYILQLSESPSANAPERYAARLLGSIMGDDSGSRLFWDLVDPGLLEYAGVATYEYEGSGLAMTLLCCEGGTGMENLARLETAQKKLSEEGVTEDELERAKRKVISGLVLQSERPESRMFSVGSGWLIHGDYKSTRDQMRFYESVSMKDLNQVLTQYPYGSNFTIMVTPETSLPS